MSRPASVVTGLLVLLLSTAQARADTAHLLMGTWTVDLSKLAIPHPPKSVTIVLAAVDGGEYKMSVDIVDNDGAKRHGASTFKADGTPTPVDKDCDDQGRYGLASFRWFDTLSFLLIEDYEDSGVKSHGVPRHD
jgi:hypothetical protein